MSEDNFDDGLVHDHRWASEATPPHAIDPDHEHDLFDDGIEHSHDWARR